MRKPLGVIAAAVVLALMAGLGLAGVAIGLGGVLLVRNPLLPAGHLGDQIRIFFAVFNFIVVCILAFCLWIVAGLFRMRTWARYSIIVLGVFTAVFFGAIAGLILHLAKFVRGPMAASGASALSNPLSSPLSNPLSNPGTALFAVSLFYAAIALIGIWWVVYFNLKPVREAFAAAPADSAHLVHSEYGFWHVVVVALAILMLIGGAGCLITGLSHVPLYLFGWIVHGRAILPMAWLIAAIQLFIGIGLLRRNQAAYWTALAWQVYGLLTMAFLLTSFARMKLVAFQEEFGKRFSTAPAPMRGHGLALGHLVLAGSVVSSAVFLIFIYALLRCRRWYVPPAAESIVYP